MTNLHANWMELWKIWMQLLLPPPWMDVIDTLFHSNTHHTSFCQRVVLKKGREKKMQRFDEKKKKRKKWNESWASSQAYSSHFHFFCSLDWEKIISQLHITLILAEQSEERKKEAKKSDFHTWLPLHTLWGSMKNVLHLASAASCGHFFLSPPPPLSLTA